MALARVRGAALADAFDIGAQLVTSRDHGGATLLEVGTVGLMRDSMRSMLVLAVSVADGSR